jgi:hypothetical protein
MPNIVLTMLTRRMRLKIIGGESGREHSSHLGSGEEDQGKMRDDPKQIAKNLVRKHGLHRARRIAVEGTAVAKEEDDNYGLSVWREVKVALVDEKTEDKIRLRTPS